MKINLLVILFLSIAISSFAQNSETIISSRPGQAFAPDVVGTGWFQLQSGINFTKLDIGNPSFATARQFSHNSLLRYGLSKRLDLRAMVTLTRENFRTELLPDNNSFGINDIEFGVRYNILDGNSNKSKLALQADIGLPVRAGDFSSGDVPYDLLLIYSRPLIGSVTLTTNLGLESIDFTVAPFARYVVNINFPVTSKLSAFVETYGTYVRQSYDEFSIFFDGGLAFLVNNDFQFDMSFGYSGDTTQVFVPERQWFIDGGISIRFQ
ncbi:MAG: transporter [Bacteroidota bacterium]